MKEIKFRAWAKVEKKLCNVNLLNDKGAFLIGIEPSADQFLNDGKLIIEACKDGRFLNNGEFELMQFTGLKDKNGKEIYEGDVIKTLHFTDTEDHFLFHYVRWDNDFNAFTVINHNNTVTDLKTNGNTFLYILAKESVFEVIGNIHEHESLLKTK